MATGKKKTAKMDAGSTHSIREHAENKLAHSQTIPSRLEWQTPGELIHELQVHQIELETQAEELRRAHLALEESRDKFLDLYDFAPIGYLTLNDKALIKEMNLTGALFLGIVRRRLIKARFRKFIMPKNLDLWDRHFVNVLTSGEKQIFELELMHSNGSAFPVRLDCIRMKKEGERPTVRIAIIDITRQKEAEAAIRESEERFWYLFSEIPLPYQSLDAEGRILEVSPRWLETLGYTRNEVIWRWFGDFLAPESQEMFRTVFKKYKESGAISNIEFLMRKKDGSELRISYTGRIGHNLDGSFRQTYCILTEFS